MKVLVTGATGLLGNHVVRQLLARGDEVRVLVRPASLPSRALAGLDVEIAAGPLASVAETLAGCDGVIHCAANVHLGCTHSQDLQLANVEGTAHVLQAARRRRVRLVQVSTIDAACPTDRLPSPYAASKKVAENMVLTAIAEGADCAVVRPAFLVGPYDWKPSSGRLLLDVAAGRVRFAPPGNNVFADARTVAACCLLALDAPRPNLYQPGGTLLSYRQFFEAIARVTGCKPPLFTLGPHVVRAGGRIGDFCGWLLGRELSFNRVSAEGSIVRRGPQERAVLPAGLNLVHPPLEQTLADTFAWFSRREEADFTRTLPEPLPTAELVTH